MNFNDAIKIFLESSSKKLYHATDSRFDKFDAKYASGQMGIHLGSLAQAIKVYEEILADGKNPRILEVEAAIENPLKLEDQGGWQGHDVSKMVFEALGKKFVGQNLSSARLTNIIQQAGYDSVVYANNFEADGDSYIIFDGSRINILRQLNKKEIEKNRINESTLLEYSFNVIWDSYMLKNKYDIEQYGTEEETEKAKSVLRKHLVKSNQKHLLDEMDWTLTNVGPGNVGEILYSFNYMSSEGDAFYKHEFDHDAYTKIRFGKKFKVSKKSIDAIISDPRLAYRGMSMKEYANAKKNKYFKSDSGYNLGDAQQDYTFFGSDYDTGRFYATTFTTTATTKNKPHVIIAVDKKYLDNAKELQVGNENEWVTKDKIPFDNVEKIWVLAPIEDFGGYMQIAYDEQTGKTKLGSSSASTMNYQLVEIK